MFLTNKTLTDEMNNYYAYSSTRIRFLSPVSTIMDYLQKYSNLFEKDIYLLHISAFDFSYIEMCLHQISLTKEDFDWIKDKAGLSSSDTVYFYFMTLQAPFFFSLEDIHWIKENIQDLKELVGKFCD